MGLKKSYVIERVGQEKIFVCLKGGWVGQKKAQNVLKAIFEWSLKLVVETYLVMLEVDFLLYYDDKYYKL